MSPDPIHTRADLDRYRSADAAMNGVDRWRPVHALTRGVVHFLHVLRLCEYWENQPGPLAAVATVVLKARLRRLSVERRGEVVVTCAHDPVEFDRLRAGDPL